MPELENPQKTLNQAVRHLQIADHMTYVTYPLINEKRLLLKIFEEIYLSLLKCIISLNQLKSKYFKTEEENLKFFFENQAKLIFTNEQIIKLKEIIELNQKHKKSAVEFVRKDKIVILSDNLKTNVLDIKTIKLYLIAAKELLMKVNNLVKK